MRPFIILQVIPIITSIKSLRKNKGINVGSFGDAPFITVMDPEPATPPETYTGVTYDTDTKTFEFDAGSAATNYVVNPPNSAVRSPYDGSNHGLKEVNFVLGEDYADPLNQFQPSEYTVTSCSPTNSDDNTCLPGQDDVGLQLSNPLTASSITLTS